MDTGLLNLNEEHFSFNAFNEYDCHEDSTSDTNRHYFREWADADVEEELNGDIALIPVGGGFNGPIDDIANFTEEPPDIFERFGDWNSTYINIDVGTHDPPNFDLHTDDNLPLNGNELDNFDLTKYMLGEEQPKKPPVKAPCKKIDINAQKYIVDEETAQTQADIDCSDDLIDVETVLDDVNLPVLEANDALGLLEQFEASETPNLDKRNDKRKFTASFGFEDDNNLLIDKISTPPVEIFDNIGNKSEVASQKNDKQQQSKQEIDKNNKKVEKSNSFVNNKQILNALPQELIARINESGKRKTITVIPPIVPSKKRANRSVETTAITATAPNHCKTKIEKILNLHTPVKAKEMDKVVPLPTITVKIHNDHDYCSKMSPYPKEPQKDSGFQSSEDDDRIGTQPMVKTADGKLMVSLLKVNTIRNNSNNSTININQKKKLNLEEYKKKRLIKLNTSSSQCTSSSSSTCSSPLPEDENVKRLRHQEKLQKMANELLKTAPKSLITTKKSEDDEENGKVSVYPKIPESFIEFPYVVMTPPGLKVRQVVNLGTNTDVSNVNNKELLESLKQLEEIEPLLKKASDKINSNSFINSLIENIPKMRTKKLNVVAGNDEEEAKIVKTEQKSSEMSERKVHYLPIYGAQIQTKSVEIQTDFDELIEDIQERYRRRLEESSSSISGCSVRSKSPASGQGQRSPTYSTGSSSSSSSYSRGRKSRQSRSSRRSDSPYSSSSRSRSRSNSRLRSRSRSFSPKRSPSKYSVEKLREVEERRVVYVGGLLPGATKDDLRRRFARFGLITNISIHFREFGPLNSSDNYGFVTFANKLDAYRALEQGNSGNVHPKYELSFGGRRIFCKTSYSDLDNMRDEDTYYASRSRNANDSFDDLLRVCQERLKRKP